MAGGEENVCRKYFAEGKSARGQRKHQSEPLHHHHHHHHHQHLQQDLHDEISGLRSALQQSDARTRVHALGRVRAAAVQSTMIAEMRSKFDQEVCEYEQVEFVMCLRSFDVLLVLSHLF